MSKFIGATLLLLGSLWNFGSSKIVAPKVTTPVIPYASNSTNKPTTTSPLPKNSYPSSVLPSKKPSSVAQKTTLRPVVTSTSTKAVAISVPVTSPSVETPKPQTITVLAPDFAAINTFARTATVNILCTVKGSEFSPISGTGVIISPDGVVLTNAHVGQYFLLHDFRQPGFIKCILRTGSPAYPTYNVELMYISPTWVENNKTVLKDTNPQGTGENDFAFLRITGRIDGGVMPTSFPFIKPNTDEIIKINDPVVLVSYPAGFLGGLSILQNLDITSAETTVQDYFTYKENTIDLISVPGTVVSQKGASGGGVIDRNSSIIGIITTSSEANSTNQRDLRAVTLSYINRTLHSESGLSLSSFLAENPASFAATFQTNTAPRLTKLITDELLKP